MNDALSINIWIIEVKMNSNKLLLHKIINNQIVSLIIICSF